MKSYIKLMQRILFVATLVLLVSCSKEEVLATFDSCYIVRTVSAEEITDTSASLSGLIINKEGDGESGDEITCYFYLSKDAYDVEQLKETGTRYMAVRNSIEHSFRVIITGLDESTLYYYVGAAMKDGEEILGEVKTFTTSRMLPSIECKTKTPIEILAKRAILRGEVIASNVISDIVSVSFYYSDIYSDSVSIVSEGNQVIVSPLESKSGDVETTIDNLTPSTSYYYLIVAKQEGQIGVSAVRTFKTPASDPQMIDLGLSVKWASTNIGADSPEDYGYYYSWAETNSKQNYTWDTYKWYDLQNTSFSRYNRNDGTIVDGRVSLSDEDDVASVCWGIKWRMPSKNEVRELIESCTWTWTVINNVSGYLIRSNISGFENNTIFLPAAGYKVFSQIQNVADFYGYYWSSSLSEESDEYAYNLQFCGGVNNYRDTWLFRYYGLPVRPVASN